MCEQMEIANGLLEGFNLRSLEEKWLAPFPMGVFGTLRKGCGNHVLMGRNSNVELDEDESYDWKYEYRNRQNLYYAKYLKGFLPHFKVSGLSINSAPNQAAQFEVYCYNRDNWLEMIPSVDRLESFNYKSSHKRDWGYHRTLVHMRILPDDYAPTAVWRSSTYATQSLDMPHIDDWGKYPTLPVWVYSSFDHNVNNVEEFKSDSPVIWYGENGEENFENYIPNTES